MEDKQRHSNAYALGALDTWYGLCAIDKSRNYFASIVKDFDMHLSPSFIGFLPFLEERERVFLRE
jgi:hypothetical protein